MANSLLLLLTFFISTVGYLFTQKFSYPDEPKQHAFIGVEACGMCHKTEKQGRQLEIWKNSKHAQAYNTLKSEKSDMIAANLGYKTPAVETGFCLKCHASGFDVDESLLKPKFKVEDGVQCETCHGAGDDYKSIPVMKDRELAVKNGLFIPNTREDLCVHCHNPESPTFMARDFEDLWEEIKHDVPKE